MSFDPRFSWGNIGALLVFVCSAAVWYATAGTTLSQIKTIQEDAKIERREMGARISALELLIAEQRRDNTWIIESLKNLQRDRGLSVPPR